MFIHLFSFILYVKQFTIIDLIKIYFKSENIELEQEILIKVWFKC